jgi:hypothetical protein
MVHKIDETGVDKMVQEFWKSADNDRDGFLTLIEFTQFMKRIRATASGISDQPVSDEHLATLELNSL